MTREVHIFLSLSVGYAGVGTARPRNPRQIIMLRFPESGSLSTRGHPRTALYTRSTTR